MGFGNDKANDLTELSGIRVRLIREGIQHSARRSVAPTNGSAVAVGEQALHTTVSDALAGGSTVLVSGAVTSS